MGVCLWLIILIPQVALKMNELHGSERAGTKLLEEEKVIVCKLSDWFY